VTASTEAVAAKAFISGCAGPRLTAEEKVFFASEQPFGLILFKRNCREPAEIRDLTAEFRDATGRPDAPVFIDQEGGRVQRLQPPHWPAYPAARSLGELAEMDIKAGQRAAWLHGRLIAADLVNLGIDVDCIPVLDVIVPSVTEAIGNRSFGPDPQLVATLGRSMADGTVAGGVLPVVKHMPGHGRALSDSHKSLPVIDADLATLAASDFVPFAALSDLPIAMTAHVVLNAVDRDHPATASATVIRDIIRKRIGFDGLLVSDDVSMNALSGDYSARAASIYAAGCDLVLHCNGRTEEMREIGGAAPALGGKTRERALRALKARQTPTPLNIEAAREEYTALLARVGWPGRPS
jgi:beta-N-acetylhexosaminidase